MGFLSRVTGFDQSRGAFNAVLASYIFEAIDIHKKKRVADEVLQIVGSVWKHYDRAEIARKLNNEIRVVQCNFLALAFDNLGVEAPGRHAWWRVNNPFVLTSQITDTTLRHAAEVVSRDDGFAVSWPGNAARIDFVTVCGIGPKPSSPAPAPLTMTRKPLVTSHTSSDEVHWARALEEFEGANRRRGLWAKSFAEADGDEVKEGLNNC